jgi:hypothetical protein
MIQRRSFITGMFSLVVVPTVVRTLSIMPTSATSDSGANRTARPGAPPVAFRIHGWDQGDFDATEKASQDVVAIHLTNSWQSAWL